LGKLVLSKPKIGNRKMAKSVASIATKIVGFPYKVEPPYAEGVV